MQQVLWRYRTARVHTGMERDWIKKGFLLEEVIIRINIVRITLTQGVCVPGTVLTL